MEPNPSAQTSGADIRARYRKTPSNRRLLESAWTRQEVYSDNAQTAQTLFMQVRRWIIILNVVAVFFSVTHAELGKILIGLEQAIERESFRQILEDSEQAVGNSAQSSNFVNWLIQIKVLGDSANLASLTEKLNQFTGFCLILLPIVLTALLAFAVKFDKGNNWVLLRGSAESLKMEIFCYRTQVGEYMHNRDGVLARKIKLISERLKGSAVHQSALNPYEEEQVVRWKGGVLNKVAKWIGRRFRQLREGLRRFLFGELDKSSTHANQARDDQYSDLDPPTYLNYRLKDQFDWYRKKSKHLDKQLRVLQTWVYFFGGAGALLAAIQLQSWVAFTTALTAALLNYLEFKRVETTLVGYNQAADALYDIQTWWTSLTTMDRENADNFTLLVQSTEDTIRSEHTSWLQDMQDKLAQLYGKTDSSEDKPEQSNQTTEDSSDGQEPEVSK